MHKASKFVVDYCVINDIGTLVMAETKTVKTKST